MLISRSNSIKIGNVHVVMTMCEAQNFYPGDWVCALCETKREY